MNNNRLLAFVFCIIYILIRWYRLWDAPFFDYDSVKDTLIAKEILQGDFTLLFHHGTPLVHLFHAGTYFLLGNNIICLPPILESIGLILMIQCLIKMYKITDLWIQALIYSIIGCSFLMIHLGRNISLEPYSIFIFPFWLQQYMFHLQKKESSIKHFLLLGLLILINYKMLLLAPFIFTIDIIRYKIRIPLKEWLHYLYAFWIIPICMCLSLITSGKAFNYLLTLGALLFSRSDQQLQNKFSIQFYIKYLIRFEHPLIWIGMLAIVMILLTKKRYTIEQKLLPWMIIYWICFMSFFPAAPRGISMIIPLLLFFGTIFYAKALNIRRRWKQSILIISLMISVAYQIFLIQTNTFQFCEQKYSVMAMIIKKQHIKKIYTTISNGIIPYLDDSTEVEVVMYEDYMNKLPIDSYILSDAEAMLNGWKAIQTKECIFSINNPCKEEIMLALENAEYAGYDFEEALLASKNVTDLGERQLCLYRVR
jgi:hypothetical protein